MDVVESLDRVVRLAEFIHREEMSIIYPKCEQIAFNQVKLENLELLIISII